jgi:hypothetical protein
MKNQKLALAAVAIALFIAPALKAQERFQAGQWEIVFTGDNPHTSTICLTPTSTDGVNGTAAEVRAHAEKAAAAGKFTMKDYNFDGTTLSMTLVSAERTFVNKASYHGDSYEGVIVTKKAGVESTTRMKGRRLGACP